MRVYCLIISSIFMSKVWRGLFFQTDLFFDSYILRMVNFFFSFKKKSIYAYVVRYPSIHASFLPSFVLSFFLSFYFLNFRI